MQVTTAPAKIILTGEHAVVYGVPAIAIPLPQISAHITIKPSDTGFHIIATDTNETLTLRDSKHPLIKAAVLTFETLQINPPDIVLNLKSDIPLAGGLGSGAAVSTAIIKSMYHHNGFIYDYAKINAIVFEIEKIHHGTPSGIDNTVIVYEKPIYYIRGQQPQFLDVKSSLHFVIADTGTPASTKITVAHVKSLYESNKLEVTGTLQNIHKIVDTIRDAMTNGNLPEIGEMMLANHVELKKLGVSTDKLDTLVNTAIGAGAYGAKLSGGGGGGNMIALTSEDNQLMVRDALENAGAKRTYLSTLEPA